MRLRCLASMIAILGLGACASVDPGARPPTEWTQRLLLSSAAEMQKSDASNEAREALIELGADAVPSLIEAIEDTSIPMANRVLAVGTLGEMGEAARPAVPALLEFIEHEPAGDPDSDAYRSETSIRQFFGLATLMRIGPAAEPAVPRLIERLRRGEDPFRALTVRTLGAVGHGAADAVPVLARGLHDESPRYRTACRAALRRILELDDD